MIKKLDARSPKTRTAMKNNDRKTTPSRRTMTRSIFFAHLPATKKVIGCIIVLERLYIARSMKSFDCFQRYTLTNVLDNAILKAYKPPIVSNRIKSRDISISLNIFLKLIIHYSPLLLFIISEVRRIILQKNELLKKVTRFFI